MGQRGDLSEYGSGAAEAGTGRSDERGQARVVSGQARVHALATSTL